MNIDPTTSVVQTGLALQAMKTETDLAAEVARKTLEIQKTEGALAVKLIESAREAAPEPKGLIDVVA